MARPDGRGGRCDIRLGRLRLGDEASEARAGQDLAAKVCSPCHAVAETPRPPFAEIAKGERAAPEALRDFLHATHSNMSHPGAMPNPELTDSQIEEISPHCAGRNNAGALRRSGAFGPPASLISRRAQSR
jgi:hypothetical protein